MLTDDHLLNAYTDQVLSYALGPTSLVEPAAAPDEALQAPQRAERLLRAARQAKSGRILLLGLGQGHLARELARQADPDLPVSVVSLEPEQVRALFRVGRLDWRGPGSSATLVVDTSPWAVSCLLLGQASPAIAPLIAINPETGTNEEKNRLRGLKQILTRTRPFAEPVAPDVPGPRLSLAAILHPEEPDLADFFSALASLAGLADEAALVWDAPDVPEAAMAANQLPFPVRHAARPLGGDFAAQRNAMLSLCRADYVLYLDADERPSPALAAALPDLLASRPGAVAFARQTLFPDHASFKIGYGLWPDFQIRLFARRGQGRIRFAGAVHERPAGLADPLLLALDTPIRHLSRLIKDPAALRRKLAVFDACQPGQAHRLSLDYPRLPVHLFDTPEGLSPAGRLFVLPGLTA